MLRIWNIKYYSHVKFIVTKFKLPSPFSCTQELIMVGTCLICKYKKLVIHCKECVACVYIYFVDKHNGKSIS